MKILQNEGEYFILMGRTFSEPTKASLIRKQIVFEINSLGLGSMGIITIISAFMGAVITLQTASNIDSALIPEYTVGFTARQSMILEFSTTIIALILAGKVGSNIASEIGMMKVTEQIDALEIMGVNSASFLILPKIIATIFFFPFLVIISMGIGMIGAWIGGLSVDVTTADFLSGLKYEFNPFYVTYSLIKTVFFAFIIASVSSYFGYFTKGGSIAVGKSSTKAVVSSSILILVCNFILTNLLLA